MSTPVKLTALALVLVDVILILGYFVSISGADIGVTLFHLLDLDGEKSLAMWFSSAQLFVAGALFAFASVSPSGNSERLFCALWAAALLFLSADEALGFHEAISRVFREVSVLPRFSGNHGIWIPIYTAVGLLFLGIIAKPAVRLWRRGNGGIGLLFAGLAIFVCGAVVLEIMSYGELRAPGSRRLYRLQVAVEEGLELIGISVILLGAMLITARSEIP